MQLELCVPVNKDVHCPKEYRMVLLTIEPEQISDSVSRMNGIPFSVKKWAE